MHCRVMLNESQCLTIMPGLTIAKGGRHDQIWFAWLLQACMALIPIRKVAAQSLLALQVVAARNFAVSNILPVRDFLDHAAYDCGTL